jgi:hypothetical protein
MKAVNLALSVSARIKVFVFETPNLPDARPFANSLVAGQTIAQGFGTEETEGEKEGRDGVVEMRSGSGVQLAREAGRLVWCSVFPLSSRARRIGND